jgi:hypothetical protein
LVSAGRAITLLERIKNTPARAQAYTILAWNLLEPIILILNMVFLSAVLGTYFVDDIITIFRLRDSPVLGIRCLVAFYGWPIIILTQVIPYHNCNASDPAVRFVCDISARMGRRRIVCYTLSYLLLTAISLMPTLMASTVFILVGIGIGIISLGVIYRSLSQVYHSIETLCKPQFALVDDKDDPQVSTPDTSNSMKVLLDPDPSNPYP